MSDTRANGKDNVYEAINSERNYQDHRWPGRIHSIDEYILFMEHHLQEARKLVATTDLDLADNRTEALNVIRKVTALGVVCMEDNGSPLREGWSGSD